MKSLYYFALLAYLITACQPDLKPLGAGKAAPIACHIIGDLDGQPLRFEAGIENNFMHTYLESNALQTFESTASIKPDPCQACANNLEITIRDFERNDGSRPMTPDSTFQIKTYPYQLGATGVPLRRVSLRQSNLDGPVPIQNNWTVFDLANNPVAESNQLQADLIIPYGNYITRLVSTFANGCTDTSTNQLQLDSSIASGTPCSAQMLINRIPSSTSIILDTFNVEVPNPTQVTWRIGGTTLLGGNVFLMTDSLMLDEVFEVELEIASASCVAKVVQRIAKNPAQNCATGFRITNIQSVDPIQLGHVRVQWTDAQGQIYGSEIEKQPSWANFEITAIDTFPKSRDGLPTLLISGQFNGRLYQSNGNSHKDLRNAAFKMAFPYKP